MTFYSIADAPTDQLDYISRLDQFVESAIADNIPTDSTERAAVVAVLINNAVASFLTGVSFGGGPQLSEAERIALNRSVLQAMVRAVETMPAMRN